MPNREDVTFTSFTLETRERYAVVALVHHETKAVSTQAYPIEGWSCISYHDKYDEDPERRATEIVAMVQESGDCGYLCIADDIHLFLGITSPHEKFVAEEWQEIAEDVVKRWLKTLEERRAAAAATA